MARSSKASTRYPKDLATVSQSAMTEWRKDGFTLKSMTTDQYQGKVEQFQGLISEVGQLEVQLAQARERRDTAGNELWDGTRQIRNAAKAYHGDDSDEVRRYGLEPVRRGPRRKTKEVKEGQDPQEET